MKNALILFSLLFLSSLSAQDSLPPHIGPVGLRFNHLHVKKIEKMIQNNLQEKGDTTEDKQIAFLLTVGKRASQWLNTVNANRLPENKLDLASPGGSKGVPIHEPLKTSTVILMQQYNDFIAKTDKSVTDVLASSQELPPSPPVSDLEFVNALRTLDRIYQGTIRWAGSQEWLSWYIGRSIYDVRGFLFLKEIPDLETKLGHFSSLDTKEKAQLKDWLLGLCRNGDFDSSDCVAEFRKHQSRNTLFGYYNRFYKYGKSMYDLFYTIKKTRPEIHWNKNGDQLFSPFQKPEREDVTKWLKENVEDEWKSLSEELGFHLVIDYKVTNKDIPRIQFKEGVTANVNGIAGNLITMEAEYPIESSDQKWTIRHEYGHVLGFEDCYLEFYDPQEKAMIYYEIDVDNLMCSRKGKLKLTHVEQLKKAYK